jgi:hypothetical protein
LIPAHTALDIAENAITGGTLGLTTATPETTWAVPRCRSA